MDLNIEIAKLRETYAKKGYGSEFKLLGYGNKGSGKTTLVRTGRRPIFIDSFDPGGTLSIKEDIDAGYAVADVRWETDDPKAPAAFVEWERVFQERRRAKFFDQFGTYSLDSFTMFSQVAMNQVLKKAGRAGGIPQTGKGADNDYVVQMLFVENALAQILSLPCDVILTCHPDIEKDEETGRILNVGPLITGKAKQRIPLAFSEMYYLKADPTKDGIIYSMLTRLTNVYKASTRLGRNGRFDMYEKPDIKLLLKKAGLPCEDKPIPWL